MIDVLIGQLALLSGAFIGLFLIFLYYWVGDVVYSIKCWLQPRRAISESPFDECVIRAEERLYNAKRREFGMRKET